MSAASDFQQALELARKGRKKNAHVVVPLLRSAAAEGHAMAAHALATWYIFGIGVPRDLAAAMDLEKQAAKGDVVDAILNLGRAHELGEGVPKDPRKALRLYRRAARLGSPEGMEAVGRCFHHGIGTSADEQLALRWLDRARMAGKTLPDVARLDVDGDARDHVSSSRAVIPRSPGQ